jgi:hypothetical protein
MEKSSWLAATDRSNVSWPSTLSTASVNVWADSMCYIYIYLFECRPAETAFISFPMSIPVPSPSITNLISHHQLLSTRRSTRNDPFADKSKSRARHTHQPPPKRRMAIACLKPKGPTALHNFRLSHHRRNIDSSPKKIRSKNGYKLQPRGSHHYRQWPASEEEAGAQCLC